MATGGQKTTQTMMLTLDGGMDQRTHPRQTAAPSVLESVNTRFRQLGGVEKRDGLTRIGNQLNSGWPLVGGQGRVMAGLDNELLVTDGYHVGSLSNSPALGLQFTDAGKVPECTSVLRPIDSSQYQLLGPDVCYSTDGMIFHAQLTASGGNGLLSSSNEIYAMVEDATTGAIISPAQSVSGLGTWWTPVLCALANNVVLFWRPNIIGGPATSNLMFSTWNRSTLTWTAPGILRTDLGGDFAVCANSSSFFILGVFGSPGSPGIFLLKFNPSLSILGAQPLSTPSTGIGLGFGVAANNNIVYSTSLVLASSTSTIVNIYCNNANTLASISGPSPIFTANRQVLCIASPVILGGSAQNCVVAIGNGAYKNADTLDGGACAFPVVNQSGAIVGNASAANRTSYWTLVASKPFSFGDGSPQNPLRAYCFVYCGASAGSGSGVDIAPTAPQYTHMLVELGVDNTTATAWNLRPITWQAPRYAFGGAALGSANVVLWGPTSVAQLPNNVWVSDAIIQRNNRNRVSAASHYVNFGAPSKFLTCKLGQTLFMTPGFYWDKTKMAEISYAHWPQSMLVTQATTGGNLSAGTYIYRAMYEFVDANGFTHQSQASDPISIITSGTTSLVTLQVPTICITNRQSPGSFANGIRIVIYRQNPTTGQYLRLFPEGGDPLNDTTKQFITIQDGLTSQPAPSPNPEELYTDAGVFPNVMPAGFTSCVTYRNRVWVSYGHTLNYSKAFVTGATVNFTDAFELPLEETGDITAQWVMDDTIYASTNDRLYYLQANGPNDAGVGNDIDTPNRVASDFGCIEPRSVAVTQVGTIYLSRVGFQLLSRNRTVSQEPLGTRIQTDLANFPNITSACVHPNGRYVTWCAYATGAGGIRMVYDYSLDRWSRDTCISGTDEVGAPLINECTTQDGKKYVYSLGFSGLNNVVYLDDPTTNMDDGSWVTMSVNLAEIHPLGLQGNVSFLKWTNSQIRISPYNLTISFFKDYESTAFLTTAAWTDTLLSALPNLQFSVDTQIHRAQSMRMKMTDSRPSGSIGTGKGAFWIGLACELDPLDNKTFKLPAANKV